MKRVLITGASGFVGNNLARALLARGDEVHLLLRPGHKSWRIEDIVDRVRVHLADFSDRESLAKLVRDARPEWIFHLAAYGAYSSQTDILTIMHTNILGTINLLDACAEKGFEAFVNTGSSSEYGFKAQAPSEDERLEPNSPYAVSKASATLYCRYTARKNNLPVTTLRLYSVYGPYEEPTRLMPTLIMHGLRGTLPPLVDPDVARDFIYVDDVNEAYLLAAGSKGQEPGAIYNVGSGVQTTIREAVEVARRVMKIGVAPNWGSMENRIWDTRTWVSDNRLIKEKLGWRPRYDFESGFRKMAEWFLQNPNILEKYNAHLTPPARD
ncbi:MAG: NAD-dependent epimerase/dehydratase family protein [Candidatus Aureabacteria bacterium]|nr:NAD-dependent epimerase/dehydratase family protein [Candidatus Auribacterota bacterium]